ncbi:hypothetical protein KRX57_08305 [Weeksellaceae bacterium TAE3-ERU29]|nr:hypothetical protein [Weeksellaceae bacterium TAE3-ERU29]
MDWIKIKKYSIFFFLILAISCRRDITVKNNVPYSSFSIERAKELDVLIKRYKVIPNNLKIFGKEHILINAWTEYEWMYVDGKILKTNNINLILDIDTEDYENYILSKSPNKLIPPFNHSGIRDNIYYNINDINIPKRFSLYLLKMKGPITHQKIDSSMPIEFIAQ